MFLIEMKSWENARKNAQVIVSKRAGRTEDYFNLKLNQVVASRVAAIRGYSFDFDK
ncbi:hypothetical protein PZE06_15630 [Robertmurraya sp. DFI.2.37]|uniref:hypothetical protein n=1 Tax=Robertmurraya sp. DFI.2.37 TaxID=3031819 RepID=UPI00177EDE65|nr:hypothetical protein [Robertmurraya sp. DFI.2.37]MDF1509572.1 hypothetical protein [Robertmurraya sp. DFI.2.37]